MKIPSDSLHFNLILTVSSQTQSTEPKKKSLRLMTYGTHCSWLQLRSVTGQ